MQDCLFCRIASGEIPSKHVYEDDDTLAFLDINPSAPGHTLVVSKKHYQNIMDVEDRELEKLVLTTQKVAKQLNEKLGCDVTVMQNNGRASGQIVFHIHFHVIPRKEGDGIHLVHHRMQLSDEELEEMRKKLAVEKKECTGFPGW